MRNSSSIAAVLSMQVAFIGDERAEAPITETDQRDISRLLLHRLTVLRLPFAAWLNSARDSLCT